ncbi:type VI secretion system tip protein VgrG [Aquabacterium sp. A7-Y]|uniref:type VI secretion system Vgr family protein n=1 Tax=Aquabacterium sp. A7-Y TaxID=1349605 RepID=UPI00223E423F|nr:type VI secretion system Vgr family protein [Aquabacterium sp. A7-Y]MCW7540675.1 type VI secretion system tip protein VgrG [Aquabacterium sp. A7-Y]
MSTSPLTSLAALIGGRQHARLLRLTFPNDDAPSAELLAERLQAVESLSRNYRYTVELLSDSANIPLEDLQGKQLCVSLVRADGTLRHFTGYVWSFVHVKTDGGIAFYEAVLVPWLHFLTLRQNNRLFHHQTLQQQLEVLFADYGALPVWEWKVTGEQPTFTMAVQWSEHDANYVCRRLEAAGHSFSYEHSEQGQTWVVWGSTLDAAPIDGATPDIRFHSNAGSQEENAIAQWRPKRQGISASYTVSSFDFKVAQPVHVDMPGIVEQGDVPKLNVQSYEGHYGFKDRSGGEQLARQRMEEIEARGKQYEADSNNAFVQPGRWFKLADHFAHGGEDAEFFIIEARHEARNNYLQGDEAVAEYRNTFVCQPRKVVWRPGLGWNSKPSLMLAPQSALVVGPEGTGSLNVDEYGRIQVQFHWDRDNSGSCRLRVATNWAGSENGLISHPRVGSEVVIHALDGNPDRMLVTGCVHNQAYMPPWKLPEQRALTGLRSRELTQDGGNSAGGRSNHVLLDDTDQGMQVQARSDHQSSQLSLGHITRIEDTAGRKDARGQGFELRTDGHGAVRARQGLLVTTEERLNARAHITDMAETVERLTQGQDLHQSLSDAAKEAQAHQAGDQDEVVKALQAQAADIKGSGGNPQQGEFPEYQAPHLTLASPAGIQTTTQGSTHVVSTEHNALTSGGHTSVSAGKSLLASVKEAVRLFAYKAGMKLVAASSDIDITALKDSINLLAKLNITHTANRITITAKEEVLINGGGSYSKWSGGGITHGTSGPWQVKAASFSHSGPASMGSPSLPQTFQLPKGNLELFHEYVRSTGERVQGVKQGEFSVLDSEAASRSGALDGKGFNAVAGVPMGMAEIVYGKDPSNTWDEGSYFGKFNWPPEPPAESASAMSASGSMVRASQGARTASGALGSAAGVASLASTAAGASTAGASLGQLASIASTAQQALGTVQAVQQSGAKALLDPALQLAQSKALPAVVQKAAGVLPHGFASELTGGLPGMPAMAAAKPSPAPLDDFREHAV